MNETYEAILSRRSIKKYQEKPVPEELVKAVLEAGTYAPTASNKQSPLIVWVRNRADREELERLNTVSVGREPGRPFYGAPEVAVVYAQRGNPNSVQDASLVMGNMMLAAHALGLGSCWINRAKETSDCEEGQALMRKWGVDPETWVGVGNLILGYADAAPVADPRKEGYIVTVE